MKVSLCMPTRGRAEQAARCIRNAFEMTQGHDVEMLVVAHPDKEALQILPPLQSEFPELRLCFHECTAIEGWNIAASHATGDWLKVYDDDLWCNSNWLDAVQKTWEKYNSPDVAYIGLWDKHIDVPSHLFTRAIGTREFFVRHCGGRLTIPTFQSWYDDNWKFDVAIREKCAYYCPDAVIEHRHVNYGYPNDATYELGRTRHNNDGRTYAQAKAANYPITWVPMICRNLVAT